jgi:hypothetical protein
VALLGTYGEHLTLPNDIRERLFAGVTDVINRDGGTIELPYTTHVLITRAVSA